MKIILILIVGMLLISCVNNPSKNNSTKECKSINQVHNKLTPVNMLLNSHYCAANKDYAASNDWFFIARTYSAFDKKRVKDKSAHQIFNVTAYKISFTWSKETRDAVKIHQSTQRKKPKEYCSALRSLGYPTYYPSYMIKHGAIYINNTIQGKSTHPNSFIHKINNDEVWKEVINEIAKCKT